MTIRNGKTGDKVGILAFCNDSHGEIISKSLKSGHVWYLVKVVDPGTSPYEPGWEIEMRSNWLTTLP